MKFIGKIVSPILIFFGVIFVLGAFSENGTAGWIVVGIVVGLIGLALAYFSYHKPAPASTQTQNVTVNVDLPGNVKLETLKCKSCGGTLSPEHITMVAVAPVVSCPYCKSTYQLTEEPKW